MDMPLLDHVIKQADLQQLELLHKQYRSIADDLGQRIARITEKTESARRLRSRRQMEMNNERATKVLEHQHRTGCTRLQACQHVAAETGDTPERLMTLARLRWRPWKQAQMIRRRENVGRYAKLGLSNYEIARMLDLSTTTVAKDLAEYKKRAG